MELTYSLKCRKISFLNFKYYFKHILIFNFNQDDLLFDTESIAFDIDLM